MPGYPCCCRKREVGPCPNCSCWEGTFEGLANAHCLDCPDPVHFSDYLSFGEDFRLESLCNPARLNFCVWTKRLPISICGSTPDVQTGSYADSVIFIHRIESGLWRLITTAAVHVPFAGTTAWRYRKTVAAENCQSLSTTFTAADFCEDISIGPATICDFSNLVIHLNHCNGSL